MKLSTTSMENNPPLPPKENWEEEFDKQGFKTFDCDWCDGMGGEINMSSTAPTKTICPKCHGIGTEKEGRDAIKSFFRSLLQKERESTISDALAATKKIETMQGAGNYKTADQIKGEIMAAIESL